MKHHAIPALFALAAPTSAAIAEPSPPLSGQFAGQATRLSTTATANLGGVAFAQMSIHERIIIRVPRMSIAPARSVGRVPIEPMTEWKEHKGPKCVAVGDIAGAVPGPKGSIDLLMDNGTRLRTKLDGDCKPLDYYPGFYLKPSADGLICHNRDVIRMRTGAKCEIDGFKTLRTKR